MMFSPFESMFVVTLTTSRGRDACAVVDVIIDEFATVVTGAREPVTVVDCATTEVVVVDTDATTVVEVTPTPDPVSTGAVLESVLSTSLGGVSSAVAGTESGAAEHAASAKYIHTPATMRRAMRWRHRSSRCNFMPLLLSPMQRLSRRFVAFAAVALVTVATSCAAASPQSSNDPAIADAAPSPAGRTDAPIDVPIDAPIVIDSDSVALPILAAREPVLPADVVGADGIGVRVADTSRIIVLNGAIAEIVVALGFGGSIVGRDGTTVLPALDDVTKVSNGHDITTESILSLSPTLVIGDTRSGPPESIEQLRSAGVPLLIAPEAWALSAMPQRVTMISTALGVPQSGIELNAATDDAIADALRATQLLPKVPRVAFLYVRGTASVYLLGGKGSGADELIAAVGGVDVGKEQGLGNYTPLTSEALVSANPDVLLVMTNGLISVGDLDGLLSLPGIAETAAARDRAVVAVDDDLLLSFGPRTGGLIGRLSESFAAVMAPR